MLIYLIGPGAYEYGTTKPDATVIKFGNFSRDRAWSQTLMAPGPGSYEIPSKTLINTFFIKLELICMVKHYIKNWKIFQQKWC